MDIQRLRASGALSGPYARARHRRATDLLIWIVPVTGGLAALGLWLWTT